MTTTLELDLVRALAADIEAGALYARAGERGIRKPPLALAAILRDLIDTAEETGNVESL